IPTGPLVKQNLTPDDPGDQVDQLPERLHGVPAGEPCQLARVDRHVVLPLQLLEQSEKEERIEPEVVEQMRVVAHLADVPLPPLPPLSRSSPSARKRCTCALTCARSTAVIGLPTGIEPLSSDMSPPARAIATATRSL